MVVSAVEELAKGIGIFGVNLSVVDEVFTSVLGVVRPCVLWQPTH